MHTFTHTHTCLPTQASSVGYGGAVGDLLWVQQVASIMASHMLMVCPTPFERSHLLRLLAEAGFGRGRQFKCHGNIIEFTCMHMTLYPFQLAM